MELSFKAEYDRSKVSVYFNNCLLYTGNESYCTNLTPEQDWNELVIECERLSSTENFGQLTITEFLLDSNNEWPVDLGNGQFVTVPFSATHGYTFTESGNDYIAVKNTLFTNSYIKIHFKVKDNAVVDHYYDKGPNHSLDSLLTKTTLYSFTWSDVYRAYVHRHMFIDHYMLVVDPNDRSTWSRKWHGPKFQYTDTALQEDLKREVNSRFPWGATIGLDINNQMYFRNWPLHHVFGSFQYSPLPSKYLAPLLQRV